MSKSVKIYPLYTVVLTTVSVIIIYAFFSVGGFFPALVSFIGAAWLMAGNLKKSVSFDTEHLTVRRLFSAQSIKVEDLKGIIYYHAPGGRDFYHVKYVSGSRERTLKMNSFMYKNLYEFMHRMELAGVPIKAYKQRFRVFRWILFFLFAVEGGYCLRELMMRSLSYLSNAMSGIYYIDDYTEVWLMLSLFFLVLGYRLYRRLKSHEVAMFISRSILSILFGSVLIFLVSNRVFHDNRLEMYRILTDTKFAIESRIFDKGGIPDDPETFLYESVNSRISIRRGWRRLKVEFFFEEGFNRLGTLTGRPGRIIILKNGDRITYLATYLGNDGVSLISENNSIIRINRFRSGG